MLIDLTSGKPVDTLSQMVHAHRTVYHGGVKYLSPLRSYQASVLAYFVCVVLPEDAL